MHQMIRSLLPALLLLSSCLRALAAETFVQVKNSDQRGDAAFHRCFTVRARTIAGGSLAENLGDHAECYLPTAHGDIKSLSWRYEGPPHEFVLSPAAEHGIFSESNLRLFEFERPGKLKETAHNNIQEAMNDALDSGWQSAAQEVKALEAIFNQTEGLSSSGSTSLAPSKLRRYFLELVKECTMRDGWGGKWRFDRAPTALKEGHYQRLHDYGLLLVEQAASFCDAEMYKYLAHGADRWFHSHVKERGDDWRDKTVNTVNTLPGWDANGKFAQKLDDIFVLLKKNHDLSKDQPKGLKLMLDIKPPASHSDWDEKKRAGLKQISEMLKPSLAPEEARKTTLGEMKLSEWENIFDALKAVFGA